MVRLSKQQERRSKRPHRRKNPAPKTGPLADQLPQGFKPHENAIQGTQAFFPKKI
ncbi:MAG: hypothetical protein L0207_02815 [Chlamydiae bacterium]|nr:hypothetical protein [Chlamydiota bacterium]